MYWKEGAQTDLHRGKDITETQKLLNTRLGCVPELFLAGAYSHEFSATGAFFSAKAKDRREMFENLADLQLPTTLSSRCGDDRKCKKTALLASEKSLTRAEGGVFHLRPSLIDSRTRKSNWCSDHKKTIKDLEAKEKGFEAKRQEESQELEHKIKLILGTVRPTVAEAKRADDLNKQIELASSKTCPTCKAPSGAEDKIKALRELSEINKVIADNRIKLDEVKRLQESTKSIGSAHNTYGAQLKSARADINPFDAQINSLELSLEKAESDKTQHARKCEELTAEISCLSILYDLAATLRGRLLQISVSNIEHQTNDYLTRFFDGEFRVGFTTANDDDINVTVAKNGHECVFKQLSKGQRCMLKLAFTVAVMKSASNRAGIHFNVLFFDESLDGLDSDLKVKAYSLFEELQTQHESIFVIEHSNELKHLFPRQYRAQLVGDHSEIKEHE